MNIASVRTTPDCFLSFIVDAFPPTPAFFAGGWAISVRGGRMVRQPSLLLYGRASVKGFAGEHSMAPLRGVNLGESLGGTVETVPFPETSRARAPAPRGQIQIPLSSPSAQSE